MYLTPFPLPWSPESRSAHNQARPGLELRMKTAPPAPVAAAIAPSARGARSRPGPDVAQHGGGHVHPVHAHKVDYFGSILGLVSKPAHR